MVPGGGQLTPPEWYCEVRSLYGTGGEGADSRWMVLNRAQPVRYVEGGGGIKPLTAHCYV
jgi:hypothetical protein